MTPIPLTETQMAELFRLRAENATLQTEIAELRIRMNAYQQAWNSDELEKSLSVENAALKEQVAHLQILERQLAKKDAELKTERIRLAACGVVALANTPDSAAKAREMLPEYRSASCDDVARTVDREMALREQLATVTAQRDLLKDALEKLFSWVDAYAETSDTEFPTVERLCVEALASLKEE